MKLNKRTINYIYITTVLFAMTACGGGSTSNGSCSSFDIQDSDGDGFDDRTDSAPNDASIPGDFSTPEKILANAEVQRILNLAKAKGLNVPTNLGKNPPNLTGYYRREYATSTEVNVYGTSSVGYAGSEKRVCTTNKGYQEVLNQFTSAFRTISPHDFKVTMFRGDKKNYTLYAPTTETCGNGEMVYGVLIRSGSVNANGDRIDEKEIYIPFYKIGHPSAQCFPWEGNSLNNSNKINDLDELEHMCVDGNKAYIPTETWTNKDKESCKCTANIETVCN